MPQFYFHYHTLEGIERDDIGCSFESLELAYLDAYRSMVEIGAELLKRQINPASHRIEIADGDGRVLMELRFDEVFRRQRGRHRVAIDKIRGKTPDAQRLKQEMADACASARASVAIAHETLRRARAKH